MARKKQESEDVDFRKVIKRIRVPILTLDNKWHSLFEEVEKTEEIKRLEIEVNEALKSQGKVENDKKDLKKIKKKLMGGIIQNTEGNSPLPEILRVKKMDKSKQLIEEINDKLFELEEEELDLPFKLRNTNEKLMLETVDVCYRRMKENEEDMEELKEWIEKAKAELKVKVIALNRKEAYNDIIYTYLHGVLGHEFMELYDKANR